MPTNRHWLILEICARSTLSVFKVLLQKLTNSHVTNWRWHRAFFKLNVLDLGWCLGRGRLTGSGSARKFLILPSSLQKLVVAEHFLGHEGIYFGWYQAKMRGKGEMVYFGLSENFGQVLRAQCKAAWKTAVCSQCRFHSALTGWDWRRALSLVFWRIRNATKHSW